ncbi:2-oxoglutarate dehydrogenase E2 component (dihydrolipoamide succinyltransferase) [Gracilibacillus halotolerans]|uniref:Dihydrolipoyllysine-residue succinyltransferase component of 2-oxoglutarate dehydrogenase complex n=1 Tax=Gracilibacillus halotolerans TaxID=74386 RepID=A0A841RF94_9BACI|nr:2-oxoglutarate dehydrogenase complex dihydrolipoyllysine-residue succinyltransferase [Gracilibacillus halotolerans]MBB6512730.1 2-oxoglutarate dehydrogenase E2 component (dihydrolipoamide succinyltransferase) [Gracilibacillus halotolerans]
MKEIKVPELAESISEGTIAEWLVKEGESVQKGDPICELETDKVNVEVNAEYSGTLAKVLKQEGEDVEVGEVIAEIDESGSATASSSESPSTDTPKEETAKEDSQAEESKESASPSAGSKDKVIASPATRKRARELGIDLSEVQASDPLGRVRSEDVEQHAKAPSKAQSSNEKKASQPAANEQTSDNRIEREKMSRRRQTIAKRLVEAQHNSAMLTTFNEIDMTAVMKLRSERKDKFQEKHGVKLGFMSFFTKAVVAALKDFPYLNAEIEDNEILLKKFYDIGIAVSTDDGLVVPVVRDADKLDFAGIESEIMDLGLKARNKELQLQDLQGGSFTITNGGIFGSLLSTPILNAPQVGILGMHTIQKRPVAMPDDTIEIRPMMYVALSYDHRIVDGKEAVQFLVRIKQLLEDPYDLLLEG